MNLIKRENERVIIVYLFDPLPLEKVALDALKGEFPKIQFAPDYQLIYAEAPEHKLRLQLQTARLEYYDESGRQFSADDVKPVLNLLNALPPLNVKGIGSNLHVRGVVDKYSDAGLFTTERLLAGSKTLEEKLGLKIFASAERIFYGDRSNFFDVRVTPSELGGEWLQVQLHKHKDINVTNAAKMAEETAALHSECMAELERILVLI